MGLRLGDNVSLARTEYGSILLDQVSGKYWQLGRTASVVLDAVIQGHSAEHAGDVLTRRFDVDPAVARKDALALLDALRSTGLMVS